MMETLQQGYGIPQAYSGAIGVGGPQIGQQGLWGNPQTQFGVPQTAPFGGMLTSGIGGLFGSQTIPRQINGVGGVFAGLDPLTAAYAQQAQLGQLLPQTLLGQIQFGQNPYGQTQGIFGNPLLQRQLDPLTLACVQQAQIVQQQIQLAQLLQQAHLVQQLRQQHEQYGLHGGQQFGQFGRSPFQSPFQTPFQGIGQMGSYGQGVPWQ